MILMGQKVSYICYKKGQGWRSVCVCMCVHGQADVKKIYIDVCTYVCVSGYMCVYKISVLMNRQGFHSDPIF